MARYFKLAPLVFCLCACLLLLVIGCAKAPADLLTDARASLIPDPAKALDQAQAAIDKLDSEPAGAERDKMLFEAKVMKLEALGFVDSAKAKSEYESLRKDAPSLMTGQVLWDIAVELREGSVGQGTAIALLDQGKKDFPDFAARYQGMIESIMKNPNQGGKDELSKLGYIGGKKDAKAKEKSEEKPKE
jgi:hypothetical protein